MERKLDEKTEAIFRAAIARIPEGETSCQIGADDGAYMPLHVEKIGTILHGNPDAPIRSTLYSFAHYFEQNGDLMRDPDICIEDNGPGGLRPTSFRNDALGIDQEVYAHNSAGYVIGIREKLLHELCQFCKTWGENLNGTDTICTEAEI